VNLMLEEPPLIVRILGLAGFMDDSFVILQSEWCDFRACGPVILGKNASNPQTSRDPNPVFHLASSNTASHL
jgi:hypothetical protein